MYTTLIEGTMLFTNAIDYLVMPLVMQMQTPVFVRSPAPYNQYIVKRTKQHNPSTLSFLFVLIVVINVKKSFIIKVKEKKFYLKIVNIDIFCVYN